MRRGFGPLALTLFLFFFALLTLPGDGNQGSVAGSCYCDRTIPSGTQIPPTSLIHMRKFLKMFHHCQFFIRFQLQSKSVCGRSQDQWVRELVNCFEHKRESLFCPPVGHQGSGCHLTIPFASATQHFSYLESFKNFR